MSDASADGSSDRGVVDKRRHDDDDDDDDDEG